MFKMKLTEVKLKIFPRVINETFCHNTTRINLNKKDFVQTI